MRLVERWGPTLRGRLAHSTKAQPSRWRRSSTRTSTLCHPATDLPETQLPHPHAQPLHLTIAPLSRPTRRTKTARPRWTYRRRLVYCSCSRGRLCSLYCAFRWCLLVRVVAQPFFPLSLLPRLLLRFVEIERAGVDFLRSELCLLGAENVGFGFAGCGSFPNGGGGDGAGGGGLSCCVGIHEW